MKLEVVDWGLIPYLDAVEKQQQIVEAVLQDRTFLRQVDSRVVQELAGENTENLPRVPGRVVLTSSSQKIIFCTHPPVVTTGRGTKPGDVFGWQGEVCETNRGGRATYHGPSQIVVYPIVDLQKSRGMNVVTSSNENALESQSMNIDLHAYMRALESAIVETLAIYDIMSEARTLPATEDSPSLTGVWVGDKKIASIGIAIRKGVTSHGLSLNFSRDPRAFSGINPCGFKSNIMTSVEDVLQIPDAFSTIHLRQQMKMTLKDYLQAKISRLFVTVDDLRV